MVEEGTNSSSSRYPIKTIVVLVQENRSFDHMLGWMKSLNPEIDGVTGSESNPLSTADPNSSRIFFGDGSVYVDPDPGHSLEDIYEQIFGEPWAAQASNNNINLPPTMQGFVQNARSIISHQSSSSSSSTGVDNLPDAVMNGFKPDALPVYRDLVQHFAVCDRWFASVPAATQPNRLYVHSATSHGFTSNDTLQLVHGFPQKTIFESLEDHGLSFGIYYQYPPSTLFYRNLRKLKYADNFHQFDLEFKRHCKEGKLPNYVVVEQRYFDLLSLPANDDHPSHDVSEGQRFVKDVYEALRASPQWNEILFLIIYDEHGGFYDHVPTPVTGVPSPDDISGPEPHYFNFDRLGVRVPAILISPWIKPGTVLHEPSGPYPTSQFEHSSIAATVKKIFNLREFLTKRDAWAGTFESVLNESSPRRDCPVRLPEPVRLRETEAKEEGKLSEFQEELIQMVAALNGDHSSDIYPHKLVEDLNVSKAAKYIESGFKKFIDELQTAKQAGIDLDEIVVCTALPPHPSSKSFAQKVFSCLVCDR